MAQNDFNGDGKSDILWRNTGQDPQLAGSVGIWEMNGPQLLSPGSAQNIASVPFDWKILRTGDFNGDGKADLLWRRDSDGQLGIWEMDGFQSIVQANFFLTVLPQGTPDFNGDGKSDLVWRYFDGTVAVALMDGTQLLKPYDEVRPVGTDWKIAGTGDFDGDHKGDILWRNDNGTVAIWEMDGSQLKAGQNVGFLPTNWSTVGTGDFDGDGKTDILWRDVNGSTSIWEMNGFQIKDSASIGVVPTELRVVGTPDLNGDGMSEILWRSTAGTVEATQMNGLSVVRTDIIATVGSDWSIVGERTQNGPAGGDAGSSSAAASAALSGQQVSNTTVPGAADRARPGDSSASPGAAAPTAVDGGSGTGSGGTPASFGPGNVTVWGATGITGDSGSGTGSATVTGFGASARDGISFPNETAAAISNVINSSRTANGDTLVTLPDGSTLTLAGVAHIDSTMLR